MDKGLGHNLLNAACSEVTSRAASTVAPLVMDVVANSNDRPLLKIEGEISGWGNKEYLIKSKLKELKKAGHKAIDLYLKSPGGSVFEAAEIGNMLESCGLEVHGYGGVMVASAATYIACKCTTFHVAPNSQNMIHKAWHSVRGNEDDFESGLKLLRNISADYKSVYAAKTGMSEDEIEALWSKGDYWMNAKEYVDKGFADGISKTPAKVTDQDITIIKACGCPNEVQATATKNLESQDMKTIELTAAMVGLKSDASDQEIMAKFDEMKTAQAKLEQFEKEKAEAEKAAAKQKVEDEVEAAIKDKRIAADQKETYVALLTADFEAGKKALDAMTPIPKISDQLKPQTSNGVSNDRKDWDYEKWSEEDPEGLQAMAESDDANVKAAFNKLYDAYVK